MGTIKVGINGFGRIARVILRSLEERSDTADIEICGINIHNADFKRMAYQVEYDSVFGRFQGDVEATDTGIRINGKDIRVFSEDDPADIDWAGCGAEYVIESTGKFLTKEAASKHFNGGAKRVILTAPAKSDGIPTFVMGVNHNDYDPATMTIVSNASCTTNCLAPLTKVIHDTFGIEKALMSTIHASTSKQKPVDSNGGRDWRTGRSVFNNIIPSTTGAAKAVGKVIPELNGKMTGMSFRVPSNDVSVVDLTAELKTPTTYEAICDAVRKASETTMKGIIEYNNDEIVSADLRGNYNTCIFDEKAGIMLDDTFVKLIAWYDNEWGYSNKVIDLVMHVARTDAKA
ncbi:MAG: type I glyceraldehyde-3-phosphate dehydrogenase [Lachnospiraceae bacterium]|jgi:glyceraldehyde 3-phosphate dehydrogenase|nr:type I glyceraldehyde-3-phosphate dehydrogenase [Lachnospiraceae bacterium]MCI1657071.1 type I glyceraldehyde-3-phosphate dehydrogenase [Lachnospiraceae bacterium]MCI2195504.1 type I glyceraldehyde-3-phosphate dehydrogenase [Lachnospiraceae bacterium]HAD20096.1 type I glyceraldehyde-3-phosphate dehydrogenase [Lachnospiraceae bacterium]